METIFKGLNILDFTEKFSTDAKCREYLSDQKWEKGYHCGNCGHENYFNGKQPGTRTCSKCKYLESATARTLFHRLKFPIRKAFHIIYTMSCTKKSVSSYELSRQLSLRQKTCWAFQQKVRQAMCSPGKHLLEGVIEVDEFFVGGPEEGKPGRGNEKKQQVVMALQVDAFGIQRCYAQVIPCARYPRKPLSKQINGQAMALARKPSPTSNKNGQIRASGTP
jgi:hypothetical protein